MRKLRSSTPLVLKAVSKTIRYEVHAKTTQDGESYRLLNLRKVSGGRILWQGRVEDYYHLGSDTDSKRQLRTMIGLHFTA
jgi:phage-related protein